jgi:hypothetical protein
MNAMDLIAREAAKPMTHVVVTTYASGDTKRHETRGLVQAQTWAHLEGQKVGRDLVSRNADMTAGPVVRVVSVEIEAL